VLSREELAVAEKLFAADHVVRLEAAQARTVAAAKTALAGALRDELGERYFRRNRGYAWFGVLLSALPIAAACASARGGARVGALFLLVWVSFWTVGVMMLLRTLATAWRKAGESGFGGGATARALGATLFALPFVAGEVGALVAIGYFTSVLALLALLAAGVADVLLFRLLPAPTPAGRQVLDHAQAFRRFLAAQRGGDGDADAPAAPYGAAAGLERYLPYAIALGVASTWIRRFAVLDPEGGSLPPFWYHGNDWTSDTAPLFGDSFGSAISAASAPSSSGSGGGGSSGGGGGGGGGGGW
jgi:hypothetical protein